MSVAKNVVMSVAKYYEPCE